MRAGEGACVMRSDSVTLRSYGASIELPALVADADERAAAVSFEFFAAQLRNAHTREAYLRAARRFGAWCSAGGVTLHLLSAVHVAAYVEFLGTACERGGAGLTAPSVKQHFAAIRHWLDYLTQKGVLPFNPALSVRGPRFSRKEGRTPALSGQEARQLFDSIGDGDLLDLRDKAMLAVMLFAVSRVTAVCTLRVRDFDDAGDGWLVLHGKRNKTRRIAAHHKLRETLRAYLAASGLDDPAQSEGGRAYLFQSAPARSGQLSGAPMHRNDVLAMVKRRCKAAGLPGSIRTHSLRTTGGNLHLQNGGKLEDLQELFDHEDIGTTRLYVRGAGTVARQEIERIHW